jgi:hypothetical protein
VGATRAAIDAGFVPNDLRVSTSIEPCAVQPFAANN